MKTLVTGASRGIGLATAEKLQARGHQLYVTASKQESFDNRLPGATKIAADMTTAAGIQTVTDRLLAKTDTLDVIFSSAGVMIMKKFADMTDDDINHLIDLNLRSHLMLTRKLLPLLNKSSNPQIVFMSSMAAKSYIVGESVYSATKGAITNFANVLRNELSPHVKVTTVHAWGVDTWGAPNPAEFIGPTDIAEVIDFIITRPKTMAVESIELGNPHQWRGGQAPWSPK